MMVSGVLIDVLASPLEAVKRLHEKVVSEGNEDSFASIVSEHFSTLFEKPDTLSQVRFYQISNTTGDD